MTTISILERLPGNELILPGLKDIAAGRITILACLVWIALPRMVRAGLISPAATKTVPDPELTLYRLLKVEGGNAYGRYNALLRRLVRFEHSLDRLAAGGAKRKAENLK